MISSLVRQTVQLMLFRGSPADLPGDARLTGMAIAVAIILNYVILRLLMPTNLATIFSVFGLLSLAAFSWGVMRVAKKPERYAQTLLALVLVSAAFSALSLVPAVWMMPFAAQGETPPAIPALISRLLTFWNLGVMAYVFRHALDTTMGRGILVTVLYFVMMGLLFYSLFLTGG